MSALRHYRLPVDWWMAPWLRPLRDGAVLAYAKLYSYCGTHGRRGLCPALSLEEFAAKIDSSPEDVRMMLSAAVAARVVEVDEDEDCWILLQWEETQVGKSAERMRKLRAKVRGDALPVTRHAETSQAAPSGDASRVKTSHVTRGSDASVTSENVTLGDVSGSGAGSRASHQSVTGDVLVTPVTLFGDDVTLVGDEVTRHNLAKKKTSMERTRLYRLRKRADEEAVRASQRGPGVTFEGVTPVTLAGDAGDAEVTPQVQTDPVTGVTCDAHVRNVLDQRSIENVNVNVDVTDFARWRAAVVGAVTRVAKFRGQEIPDQAVTEIGLAVMAVTSIDVALAEVRKWENKNRGPMSGQVVSPENALRGWMRREIPRWAKASEDRDRKVKDQGLSEEKGGGRSKSKDPPLIQVASVVEEKVTYRPAGFGKQGSRFFGTAAEALGSGTPEQLAASMLDKAANDG